MQTFKEFKPTSWAIDNKTTTYLLTIIITIAGFLSYQSIPKEQFPDIVIPTIYVSTIYPGAAPKDIENLVTKPIEKQLKSISGVKKLTSTSIENVSTVIVEFSTDMDVAVAKGKVKDAVDKAKKDLPTDLPSDPNVMEVEFSEIPILFVNIAGDYDLTQLKHYADLTKDKIEDLREITRVDIVGALDREIQINVDMYKMQAASLTMGDIERAVSFENMTISGGNINMGNMQRSLNVTGEFRDMESLRNIVINSMSGAPVYLKDVAEVKDGFHEQESYGRLDNKNVITLNVIKRGGENLLEATDKIHAIVDELHKTDFPENLSVKITGEQARQTRTTLHDLINTIIIGFILVTIILMFFMGATNAIFVGLSVPLSMCIAFLVLPSIGFTLNMIVLFAFLLGLGIVVDDAIVVIENTHRIFGKERIPIKQAAKKAAGEVFLPVLSGTATTLAPFVPLAFWTGVIGKFMHYLPITLIVTLSASLVVAYIINPVFAVDFMKHDNHQVQPQKRRKRMIATTAIMLVVALLAYLSGSVGVGNFAITMLLVYYFYRFILKRAIDRFQKKIWPAFQLRYARFLEWALRKPRLVFFGTLGLLIFSLMLTFLRQPKVEFFPKAEPNFVYVYASLPVGSSPAASDSVARIIEERVYGVIGHDNPIVESVITNVAIGANESRDDRSPYSHKAKVGVAFVEYAKRNGQSTSEYKEKIRDAVQGIPGVEVSVDQEESGPPTAKPVSIEISGDKFEDLITTSISLKHYLDSLKIPGVEELKSDLQYNKPEINVVIDRERANREGISTAQIGLELRNAIYGKEVSRYRDETDDYPIMLRYKYDQRNSIEELNNLIITYRDMNMGGAIRQIPLSAFASAKYSSTYNGIKRKSEKRVVTLESNVLEGYNENEVAGWVRNAAAGFPAPAGVQINLMGQQAEQQEAMAFLGRSLLISIMLILLILITQFNSIGRTVIIISEILLSVIGVLLGQAIFNMNFSIVMTGVGIVALAGIVVRNGILLVEFIDILRDRGYNIHDAIVEACRVRMTPVLLTATATILGMIPLAIGFNIDFASLFTHLDPKIYFGGDSVAFWGPLSWTIVFGLSFATFITLILVPVMYLMSENTKKRLFRLLGKPLSTDTEAAH